MLSTVARFLEQRHTASLSDIARHVDADPAAVRGMLDHWVRKGKVCRVPVACGGCTQCDPATIETYRWLGEAATRHGDAATGQSDHEPASS